MKDFHYNYSYVLTRVRRTDIDVKIKGSAIG